MARDGATLQNQVWACANLCYSQQTMQAAAAYLASRGVDASRLLFPYALTSPEVNRALAPYIKPERLANALLVPIVSIRDPRTLIAFDIRHMGNDPSVPRWSKIKGHPPEPIIYNIHKAIRAPKGTPIILTEAAIDAEAAEQMSGYPAIAYLTTRDVPSVVATLSALTDTVLLAFDNDAEGISAMNSLFDIAQRTRSARNLFHVVNYQGKDPGKAAENPALRAIFKDAVEAALAIARKRAVSMENDPFAMAPPPDRVDVSMNLQIPQAKVVNPFG